MSARFSQEDYAAAARALMPRGAVWPEDGTSVQGKLLRALALTWWRIDAAAVQLLEDTFPATTDALIEEWEATVGLHAADGASIEQRRAKVVARLVGAGGQSRERFISFAATLGFTITITNYAPLRVGHFNAGDAAYGQAWADAWGVHITTNTGGLPPAALIAELEAIKPAETTILLI
ncbi:YmfQ family protein [Sphingomonas sp. CBMAI 2297]|uniref:putative phage tail protein n=1 Tax=Sphingomonas sp. CBMAI 2297 TaxID=2991720 RepID=UPI002457DABE|nr:putative phage tail protein [Sphingomonas sp. CBMAI 2297]MDH4745814.1 YmfQ family protein [Sphingomonas sp. CBMAI 2297]